MTLGGTKNPYFTVKLKVAAAKYESIRVMHFKSSSATPEFFRSKRQNAVPITLKKIATTSNNVKFYNSFRGSLVSEAVNAIDFKVDDKTYITIKDVKLKESGQYTVTGCLRWINDIQTKNTRSSITMLRECVLQDETSNICLTVWGSYITKFQENCWYEITDLAVKNYCGIKLSTTPATIIEKKEKEAQLDWSEIDIKGYLDHEKKNVSSSTRVLKNAIIRTVSLNIFNTCTNDECARKVEFTAGGMFADCVICGAKMLKEDCVKKCEGKVNVKGFDENELEKKITLGINIDVLINLFGEGNISEDDEKLQKIGEHLLLLRDIDISYNISTMEVTLVDKLN